MTIHRFYRAVCVTWIAQNDIEVTTLPANDVLHPLFLPTRFRVHRLLQQYGDDHTYARTMGQLTIITMNCLGLPVPMPGLRRRLRALGRALAASDCDIACLQEVGQWRHLPLLRATEDRWPFALAMPYPYAPKGGLVMLSRLPLDATNYTPFRERGRMISLSATERHQSKGMLQTHLRVGQQNVVVINTHLSANYNARWTYTNPYAKIERAQLREIVSAIASFPKETLVIVAGDFNVPRSSWLYNEFVQAANVYDPLGTSQTPTYRPLPGLPASALQALDHILIRRGTLDDMNCEAELLFGEPTVLAHGALGYLSDHLAVHLKVRWPEPQPATAPDLVALDIALETTRD